MDEHVTDDDIASAVLWWKRHAPAHYKPMIDAVQL